MIVDLRNENQSSSEITELYKTLRLLIQTKKFENNAFKDKSDAIAVIDLAEACYTFEETEKEQQNFKAIGICYNNIASLKYKNGFYD